MSGDDTKADRFTPDASLLGRLSFAHRPPRLSALPPGQHALGIASPRDAYLLVPEHVDPGVPTPLMVLFHGGGGSAEKILPMMRHHARDHGFLLLVPQSTYPTWDLVIAGNGPDLAALDKALAFVADRFAIDPARLAFAGHSDGGSYALSLGLTNGTCVSHIIGSSAGFMSVLAPSGSPSIFLSHGTADVQIAIDRSGRAHARALTQAGYDLAYVEYDGGHAYSAPVISQGVDFFLHGIRPPHPVPLKV